LALSSMRGVEKSTSSLKLLFNLLVASFKWLGQFHQAKKLHLRL
jgi:hypothetical protein